MRRPPPQTVAAAAILAVLAALAVVSAPPQAPPVVTFASTAYDADGYRAWAALLAREGIRTSRFVLRPVELDGRIDTLVSAQPPAAAADPRTRTAADIGALAGWVRGGGRLVYAGRFPGLAQAETGLLRLPFGLPGVGRRGALRGPLAREVQTLPGLGPDRMLLVEHPGRSLLADGNGDIVVAYRLGQGEVVAVADPAAFANAGIARGDAARLAYLLARPRRAGGIVAFDDGLHGALIDRPWYLALPIPVRVTLGIGALAALLALIGSALPGPPPMPLRAAREPSSAEFIDALAALYERIGARAAVNAILVRAALATVPPNAAADARVTRLIAARDAPIESDSDLLASAKLAYLVRRELSNGGNGDEPGAAITGWARAGRRR